MSTRRRRLLGIALALVAGMAVVWSLLPPGGRMAVSVVFIGYTNAPITYNYTSVGSGIVTSTVPLGILMATNTGSVPVKIFSDARIDTSTNMSNFAPPVFGGSTGPLRPGASAMLYALMTDPRRPWWTELAYCRYGLGIRVHDKLWNTGNPVAQGMLNQLSPAPEKHWAQSASITNAPPLVAGPGFPRSRFPWTRASEAIDEPAEWQSYPSFRKERFIEEPLILQSYEFNDFVDASKPRSRYHITAPPDLRDIDFSDLSVTKR